MANPNAMYLSGPGGRFDLADPATQQMVQMVSGNPALAPQHNVSLAEIFQLQKMLERMSARPAMPTTTVYDDLKNAALQQATGGVLGQQQGLGQLAPQQMPQQMPQQAAPAEPAADMTDSGIGSLPVENFRPENYAGGGIVAFATGDVVDADAQAIRQQQAQDPSSGFYEAPARRPTSADLWQRLLAEEESKSSRYTPKPIEEYAKAREAAQQAAFEKAGISSKPLEEREKQLQELKARSAEDKADALRNFLMSTGFRMAAEASKPGNPYARGIGAITQPLAVGAAGAAPEYMAEQKELRKLTAERDKELADIQQKRYEAVLSGHRYDQASKDKDDALIQNYDAKILGIKGKMVESVAAREAAGAARNPADIQYFANGYVRKQLAKGDTRPLDIIEHEGSQLYLQLKTAEDVRRLGITTPAATAGKQIDARALLEAKESVDKTLRSLTSQQAREYRKLLQTDPEDAKRYKANMVRDALENPLAPAKPAAPATSRAPAVPPGFIPLP